MKKKVWLTSAIALATATAMTFAPVSYKVIDKVSAASAVEATNVEKAKDNLKDIFAQMAKEKALIKAYEDMTAQAAADIEAFDLNIEGTNLAEILEDQDVDYDKIEELLKAVASQMVEDYKTVKGSKFNDVSAKLDAAIEALNVELLKYTDVQIDRADIADLLKEVKDAVFAKIESGEYLDFDFLEDGGLSTAAKQEIKNVLNAEWEAPSNTFVGALKALYAGDNDALLEDVDTLYTAYEDSLEPGAKAKYAKGAAALAVGYAKQYFVDNPIVTFAEYDKANKTAYYNVAWDSSLSAVLGFVTLEVSKKNASVELEDNDDSTTNRFALSNVTSSSKTTVEAKLDGKFKGIPAEFSDVTLFSFSYGTDPSGGFDFGVIPGDIAPVGNYEAKAQAIAGAVDKFLAQNPELYNNTLTFDLKRQIEKFVREALLVQAASAVTVQDSVSTLNVTPAQMENIYNTQLKTVLDAVKAALEAKGIELAIDPVLTYNIGVTANGQVDVSKALIDSLTSKGIAAVGVKTGDASIEIALDQLEASSKVNIKKSASSAAGAKSDVYSISVTDASGANLTAFEKQYRVTLPVSGTNSNVTVAHVTDGSLTLVGGQYDAESKTITFFTNQLGDFVVVENSASFNDTANIAWAKDQIQLLANKGLLLGKGNGKFDPNGDVTRAEFTAMLVRAFNLNAKADITFSDVSENAWYYDAISAARAYGIINGRSASTFDPNAKISREEMASIASNALKAVLGYQPAANADEILAQFVDGNDVVAVHRANVALIKNEGIIQGKGKNNYDPKGDATRAEASVILAKLLDRR